MSNDQYQQQMFFNESFSQEVTATEILNNIIKERGLKEEFRQEFMNSVFPGEMKIQIK